MCINRNVNVWNTNYLIRFCAVIASFLRHIYVISECTECNLLFCFLFLDSAMRENKLNCKHFNCHAQLCRNAVGICLNHLSQTTVSHCFECNCCFPENKKQTYFCCPFSSLNKKMFGRICLLLFLSERNIYDFLDVDFWLCCWKGVSEGNWSKAPQTPGTQLIEMATHHLKSVMMSFWLGHGHSLIEVHLWLTLMSLWVITAQKWGTVVLNKT